MRMRLVRQLLVICARVLLVTLVGFWGVFYFLQTSMIFSGERELSRTPASLGWIYEDVSVPVGGHMTYGWFIPVDHPRGVLLCCHGNGGNISTHLGSVRTFHDMGLSVLIFDYGGYGKSTGRPSEKRAYADANAMWRYLTTAKEVAPGRIVIWGPSFGGGPATELACHTTSAAVILESTYLSIPKAAFPNFSWFAACFVRHRFDNEKKVPFIKSPLLVIHSRDDTLYPFEHGRRLFELATAPKKFLEIHGDHYGGSVLSGKIYRRGIEDFLGPIFPSGKGK